MATVTYAAHEQRVIEENYELQVKIDKLEAFMLTPVFTGLQEEDQLNLQKQFGAMQLYARMLRERIKRFIN